MSHTIALTEAASRTQPAARRRKHSRGVDRLFIPFVAPAVAIMTVALALPSIFTLVISLTSWSGPGDDVTWVGFRNYIGLWASETFRTSFLNTLVLVFGGGILIFAIVFASLVGLRGMRAAAFVRSVVFVPVIISPIAIGFALGFLLNPRGGVNQILDFLSLGGLKQAWLSPDLIFQMIIVGLVWSVSGYYLTIVAAGVDQIPPALYEEAELAGASRVQQFWMITLPLSWDSLSVAIVLWLISGMKTFEIVIAFVGSQGVPPLQARTAAVQQYLATTGGPEGSPQLGYASAIGIAIFALTTILVVLVRRILSRESVEIS
jgi:raffinose/stachyose/melibiose transport system permease protein